MGSVKKGWKAKILIGQPGQAMDTVGCAESVSLEIATGVEPYYCIGSREAEALVEGNIEITGSMSRAWVNIAYLALLGMPATGPNTGFGTAYEFHLYLYADKTGESGSPWLYVYGCKFETGSIDIPQDGFLTEDYDFRARQVWGSEF